MHDIAPQKLLFGINLKLHITFHVDHFTASTSIYHPAPSVYSHYLSNKNPAGNDSENHNDEGKNDSNYHSVRWSD